MIALAWLREVERQRADQAGMHAGEKRRGSARHPGQFPGNACGVEAHSPISQHRDEMQENTAKTEAGKFGNHSLINPRLDPQLAPLPARIVRESGRFIPRR